MGTLKPGATYIYERDKGVTYAREFGAEPATRQAIGWDFPLKDEPWAKITPSIEENQMWHDIRKSAKTNPTLQKALDRAIMLYKISKDHGKN